MTHLITAFVSFLGPFAFIGVCAVVFAETGLLVGFFLPGDSLLFMLGVFVGAGTIKTPIQVVLFVIPLMAIAGVQSGYWIGFKAGEKIFTKEDSKFFKKKYVTQVKGFYKKYGGLTVFLSQFVPIMRTFSPVAAGVGKMKYKNFFLYNVLASVVWGVSFPLLGYCLGQNEFVEAHLDVIIIGIVLISLIPIVVKSLKERQLNKNN